MKRVMGILWVLLVLLWTLAIELDDADLKLLRDGAKAQGASVSEFARDILHEWLQRNKATLEAFASGKSAKDGA